MDYAVLKVNCSESLKEIFSAELGEAGFDMLMETDEGVEGYIDAALKHTIDISGIEERYSNTEGWDYSWGNIQNQNWNEEWEKNYDPIIVDGTCLIRAEFHQVEGEYKYVLNITPKMSFGTGHHATTYLMVSSMLKEDFSDCQVMDAGSGTGILAILAEKLGARSIDAYDVSKLCTENTLENVKANNCSKIRVLEGTIDELPLEGDYDFILANINKNVLLEEMASYMTKLKNNGRLILSGFFEQDVIDLVSRGESVGLKASEKTFKDNWATISFVRGVEK